MAPYCYKLSFIIPLLWTLMVNFEETQAQENLNDPVKQRLLTVPKFKVDARVRIVRYNSVQIDETLLVTEYYSNELNRARIDINTALGLSATFYYSQQDTAKIFVRADASPVSHAKQCKPSNEEAFAHDLFGSAAWADGHLTSALWLKSRPDVPDYIIGFSRLMILANARRDKLQETGNESIIRNHPSKKYRLNDTFCTREGTDEESFFMIYYARAAENVEQLDYPLRIWFIAPTKAEIIVDYYLIDHSVSSLINQDEGFVDTFTYPLGLECSHLMPYVSVINEETAPKLVSFRAEIESKNDDADIRSYFIAQDGYAEAFRMDTINTLSGRFQSEYSIIIQDIRKNRRYNIREPLLPVQTTLFSSSDRQCVMTLIDSRSGASRLEHEPVIPIYQLVSVGLAYIRGVKTEAFEHLTDELPALLFPRLNARNQKETSFYHVKEELDEPRPLYSITYYFSTIVTDDPNIPSLWLHGKPLGALMQIDIRLKRRLIYKINIFGFIWALADAPNGDSKAELFTLGDRCQESESSSLISRYAELEMDLEFRESDQISYITASDALQFLHTPSIWTQELVRALAAASKLSAPHIYDIETRICPVSNEKMLVKVKGNLVDAKPASFEAVKIATGIIHNSRNPTSASSFDECFLDAAHIANTQRGYSLFSYCLGVCLIDSNPILNKNGDGFLELKKSEVFTIPIGSGTQVCSLFVPMKTSALLYDRKSSHSFWSSIYVSLRGHLLSMPLAEVRSKPVKMLNFYVRRFEIDNNRWLGDANGIISNVRYDSDSQILKGLGLPLAISKKIEPRKLDTEDLDLERNSVMNYEQCHSSCLNSIRCKSFSLCTQESSFELECLASEIEFKDSSILEQIENEMGGLKSSSKKSTITIDLTTTDNVAEYDETLDTIDLRVDRRCHIYNKNALEVFRRQKKESVKFSSIKNKSIIPVYNEEQCADRCIQRNVGFFKKTSKDKLELFRTKQSVTEYDYLKKMVALQKSNMDTWCASFSYINLESLSNEALADIDQLKLTKDGLCILSRQIFFEETNNQSSENKEEDENKEESVIVRRFAFIYNSMYMKHPGFRLKPNWSTSLELGKQNQRSFEELESIFKNHNKQQVTEVKRPEECARFCFKQSINLDFLCKSFGIFHENLVTPMEKGKPKGKTYCIFNSLTLTDARKSSNASDLFEEVPSTLGYVHYEPLESFTTNEAMIARLLLKDNYSVINELRVSHLSSLASFILFVISLAVGVVLGVKLGEEVVHVNAERRESVANPSRLFLGSLVGGSSEITHQRLETEIDLPDLKGS